MGQVVQSLLGCGADWALNNWALKESVDCFAVYLGEREFIVWHHISITGFWSTKLCRAFMQISKHGTLVIFVT